MKIKIEVEIDTKEDMSEIEDLVEVVTEFKEKIIALQEAEYDD
jgi:hypothetical protein|tara:strand:- start:464 stop:592 length:129 start_codon:yes stop_codon:yes gene_type:complete